MKLRIVIEMDNAAFTAAEAGDNAYARGEEAARILRHLSDRFADRGLAAKDGAGVMDTNGNTVGGWKVSR
jgi:hypothetical protein